MAQVLAPCLELLWSLAHRLSELNQGVPETVRIEIRQPDIFKSITEYLSYGRGGTPVFFGKTRCPELMISPNGNMCRGEERIIISIELLNLELGHPLRHNALHLLSDRQKEGVESLAEFRVHLSYVLIDRAANRIDMLQLH